ncbi:hypothetical protein TCAL_04075 [Tigriopus californicus]|uniref:Seipin n=1 Tax=Tigriopus californicus TaxID=6832 RepID=A0A553PG40_TIGCA|nr:seipin-like [Tigriopus californicus]TRY76650.1 hypothetical protein TCAL_04075 [Tigriopus californicus]|eukprot:TCALIF_04075-PA protein Name:"Similar to Bscl2 Seipin (Rattus norvegicus)" AED:0.00 eAED:0.00 QI:274/1/1/1/1/1/2/369/313
MSNPRPTGHPYAWLPHANFSTASLMLFALRIRDGMLQILAIVLLFSFVFGLSTLLYGSFYFFYMPGSQTLSHPVHFTFQPCPASHDLGTSSKCSYLIANLTWNPTRPLFGDTHHRIALQLEMPGSPANSKAGMFLVCVHLLTLPLESGQDPLAPLSWCRSVLVPFKSDARQWIEAFMLGPLQVAGLISDDETILVEFFNGILNPGPTSLIAVGLEVQSRWVDVNKAEFFVHAKFSGLRHLMFHHPIVCSLVGVSSLSTVVLSLVYLFWKRFFEPAVVVKMSLSERHALARERLLRAQGSQFNPLRVAEDKKET